MSSIQQNSRRQDTNTTDNSINSILSKANSNIIEGQPYYSSSFDSSNVKISSPLVTQQPWLNRGALTDSSGATSSDKSWMTRRWSTLSGSLIARRRKIRKKTKNSWKNRQKRRTFPPAHVVLLEKESATSLPLLRRNNHSKKNRHSLQEILTHFENETNTSSSSSLSKRLGKLLKKKGKQPYSIRKKKKRPPSLILPNTSVFFQPPTTMSSQSSSSPNNKTTQQVKFPTPPKRFSAYYVDLEGNIGKTDYKRPGRNKLLRYLMRSKNQQEDNNDAVYRQQLIINLGLFLLGFLFFPCWWIGTFLFIIKKKKEDQLKKEKYFIDLISIHTFGYLNTVFTCLSFILIIFIIILLNLLN